MVPVAMSGERRGRGPGEGHGPVDFHRWVFNWIDLWSRLTNVVDIS